MLRIFKNIRKKLLLDKSTGKPESRKGRYILYALGEMILIVLGILIALQINNWNTRRVEKETEKKIYENIKRQITDDKNELVKVKDFNTYYSTQYEIANRIISSKDRSKIDTLAYLTMMLSQYSDFHRSGNIYETLVNSGELKLLRNNEITGSLQRLEMTYSNINKLEDIHWEIIINELSPEMKGVVNYATLQIVKPEKLFSVELQNILFESIYLTKGKDSVYNKALNEINSIINLIDSELNNQ